MAQDVKTLAEPDNGKTVELRVGETVALELYENAATGYRWCLDDVNGEIVTVHEVGYVRGSEAVGGGGHMKWTLAAKAPGTTQLRLKRWRQWEGDASIQERFALTLAVHYLVPG